MTNVVIRDAVASDVPAMNSIYNEYIVDSHVSFDTEAWTDEKRTAWFEERLAAGYPIMVAESDGAVVGCSWSGPWRDKAAYRASAETTIVLAPGRSGRGIGSTLYLALLEQLTERGFHVAIAVIALPNDPSIAVHEKVGFTKVGTLEDVGYKDGALISTMLMQKRL